MEVDGVEEDGVETSNNDVGEIERYDVCDELERELVDNDSKDKEDEVVEAVDELV